MSSRDTPVRSDDAWPGRLGRYRVVGRLGSGTLGPVYKAWDDELRREVAIKTPRREWLPTRHDQELWLEQARRFAALDCRGFVDLYDSGCTADGICYLVMKLVAGGSLSDRLVQGRLSADRSVKLVIDAARSLHVAHRVGLVHRNVKPSNLLLEHDEHLCLTDFAPALERPPFDREANDLGANYLSPEQARGENHRVDARSDVFSLGLVLFELLSGNLVMAQQTLAERRAQTGLDNLSSQRDFARGIPPEISRICLRALSHRATDRYSTALDFADDLEACLGLLSTSGVELSTAPSASLSGGRSGSAGGGVTDVSRSSGSYPTAGESPAARVVPKGLRAFDREDSGFFLSLLPGPYGRDGLPESLRFWISRIDECDPQATFPIGLMYGPSGCGKSSIVKAGVIPRLQTPVTPVYLEATQEGTEARLLAALQRRCPGLPTDLSLTEFLAEIRRGRRSEISGKIVIFLDQFEQWLHATRDVERPELIAALRQCDGARLQCVILVRDDFWMAVTRFMHALEVTLEEGINSAAVDLFPPQHAQKVLTAFGRAYDALPAGDDRLSRTEQDFLKEAVAGLTVDGKVISVHVALFADMVRNKPWVPATLREVGGTQGIGVAFLEETFSGVNAPPEHRRHQRAARAVLRQLLPEGTTNIKGRMHVREKLLEVSGYAGQPREFEELMQLLDGELRLVTPADSEGGAPVAPSASGAASLPPGRYYQLTHDFLVPAIRRWLVRKQQETRRGRAELLLADAATGWSVRRESRQFPGFWPWLRIRGLTSSVDWTPLERQFLRAADRHYLIRGAISAAVLAVILIGAYATVQTVRARAWRDRLLFASTPEVPGLLAEMQGFERWTRPLLQQVIETRSGDSREVLHARMALVADDPGQTEPLLERALAIDDASLPDVADALAPRHAEFADNLWKLVAGDDAPAERRLRAAMILARQAPPADSAARDRWRTAAPRVAPLLSAAAIADPVRYNALVDGFRPIAEWLIDPLHKSSRESSLGDSARSIVSNIVVEYAADRVDVLTDVLLTAGSPARQTAIIDKLQRHRELALARLEPELVNSAENLPANWKDAALENSAAVDGDAVRQIESARGLVTDWFAFCQSLPLEEFPAVSAALSVAGYGPTHCRPYFDGTVVRIAAIWNRDGRTGQVELGLDEESLKRVLQSDRMRDERLKDLATYGTASGQRLHAAVWQSRRAGDPEVRAYFGQQFNAWVAFRDQQRQQEFGVVAIDIHPLAAEESFEITAVLEKGFEGTPLELGTAGYCERQRAGEWEGQLQTTVDLTAVPTRTYAEMRRAQYLSDQDTYAQQTARQPNQVNAWYDQGWASLWLGDDERALSCFAQVIQRYSSQPTDYWRIHNAYTYSALAAARLGRSELAAKSLAEATANEPNPDPNRDRLRRAWVQIAAGDIDGGLEQYQRETLSIKHAWATRDSGLLYAYAAGTLRHHDPARYTKLMDRAARLLDDASKLGTNETWPFGEIWLHAVLDDPRIQRQHLAAVDDQTPPVVRARQGAAAAARAELAAYLERTTDRYLRMRVESLTRACLGDDQEAAQQIEAALSEKPEDFELAFWGGALSYARLSGEVGERHPDRARVYADRAIELSRRRAAQFSGPKAQVLRRELLTLRELAPLSTDPSLLALVDELDRQYTVVVVPSRDLESKELHGLDPAEHLDRARELIAQGWRLAALDACRVPSQSSSIVASVWHRPHIDERQRDRYAGRKAAAAAAMVRLGRPDAAWPLLGSSAEPGIRTALVELLGSAGFEPAVLARRLDRENDPAVRRALVLALGELRHEALAPSDRDKIVNRILEMFRTDRDPGVHSATEWLLRRWNAREKLAEVERGLARVSGAADGLWNVTPQGHTLMRVAGPVETELGSPATEPGHTTQEQLHRRRIPRTFRIASKEVTVAQFREFLQAHPEMDYRPNSTASPDPDCPVTMVTWFQIARYCRWLSEQEGLPEDEMVYPPVAEIGPGMLLKPFALARRGYRVPTEAEWEHACRAGTTTPWYFGPTPTRLERFAWFQANSGKRTWPVGRLPPNDLGLFDLYGNCSELCAEYLEYPRVSDPAVADDIGYTQRRPAELSERGGSFLSEAAHVRSAARSGLGRSSYDGSFPHLGFRVASTVLPGDWVAARSLGREALALGRRGTSAAARRAHDQTRAAFEQLLMDEPQNQDLAWEFAEFLLKSATHWVILEPEQLVSEEGAAFQRQADGSVLAGGHSPAADTYTFVTALDLNRLAGLRIEALPDSTLPARGPGRSSQGTFTLETPEVIMQQSDGTETSLQLRRLMSTARVSRHPNPAFATTVQDAGATQQIAWEVEPALPVTGPVRLRWRLPQTKPGGPLGRFRVSASSVTNAGLIEHSRFDLARSSLNGWARLACAQAALGERQSALASLAKSGVNSAGTEPHDSFLLSDLCRKLGQSVEARGWLHRGLARWDEGSADRSLKRLAAQAMSAALEQSPDDISLLTRQARLLLETNDDAAAKLFESAFHQRGDDPLVLIARGRMFREAGESLRAEADFERAAELSRDELDRFLQAGWWTVGTYPVGLSVEQSPERTPEPTRMVSDAQGTGTLRWRPVASQPLGKVDLRPVHNADHASAYLLNYIYSPDNRSVSLLVAADDTARVWLNGELVYEQLVIKSEILRPERISVKLNAGRNTILAKVGNALGDHYLRLRLDDSPLDRGLQLAELGLWNEAAPLFRRAFQGLGSLGNDNWPHVLCGLVLLAGEDDAAYREHCQSLLAAMSNNSQPGIGESLALVCSLAPGAVSNPAQLVEFAEIANREPGRPGWRRFYDAWAFYRAGRFDSAREILTTYPELATTPKAQLLRALVERRLAGNDSGQEWFDRAADWYTTKLTDSAGATAFLPFWDLWWEFAQFEILFREARREFAAPAIGIDRLRTLLANNARDVLRLSRDPSLAVLHDAVRAKPKDPAVWKARARRHRELNLVEPAAADDLQALELNPHDDGTLRELQGLLSRLPSPDDLIHRLALRSATSSSLPQHSLRRGKLWALVRDFERAVAETSQGLDLLPDDRFWTSERSGAVQQFAGLDLFLKRLLAARPGDLHLRVCVARLEFLAGRWKSGLKLLEPVIRDCDVLEWNDYATALLLDGDNAGYREFLEWWLARAGDSPAQYEGSVIARAASLAEFRVLDPGRAVEWAERAASLESWPWIQHYLGLALLRAGRYDEAIRRLEQSLERSEWGPPEHAQNELALALTMARQGKWSEAQRWLNAAIEHIPDDSYFMWPVDRSELVLLRREAERLIGEHELEGLSARLEQNPGDAPGLWKQRARLFGQMRQWSQAVEDWERVLAANPQEMQALQELASARIMQRNWKEAAAVERRILQEDPAVNGHRDSLTLAVLLVLTGDLAAHADWCTEFLKRVAGTKDPLVADRAARAALLLPPRRELLAPAVELAELAVTLEPQSQQSPWFQATRALAAYRSEDWPAAVVWAERSLSASDSARSLSRSALAHLVIALARQRGGETKGAREAVQQAQALLDARRVAVDAGEVAVEGWGDWQIAEILFREARELIESP